jgi:hypothetical protein
MSSMRLPLTVCCWDDDDEVSIMNGDDTLSGQPGQDATLEDSRRDLRAAWDAIAGHAGDDSLGLPDPTHDLRAQQRTPSGGHLGLVAGTDLSTRQGGPGFEAFVVAAKDRDGATLIDFDAATETLEIDALVEQSVLDLGPAGLGIEFNADIEAWEVYINTADDHSALAVRLPGVPATATINATLSLTPLR